MKFIVRDGDREFPVEVERSGSGYRVLLRGEWVEVDFARAGQYVHSLRFEEDGSQYSLVHHRDGARHEITLSGAAVQLEIVDPLAAKRSRRDDESSGGGVIKALMPGRVNRILVQPGENVRKGAGLLILEAMKMENEIHAPVDGVVQEIFVTAGQTVEGGAELMMVVPEDAK